MARGSTQLELVIRTWGGRRPNAGRKPAPGRSRVGHRRREPHDRRCPTHVTIRTAAGLPSLRTARIFVSIRSALARVSGNDFRLLQFSVQTDHVHLLVEASGPTGLSRGMQGLAIRVARAVNRTIGRHGRVWGDRYHARTLATPREVRHALVYVLANWRKHVRGARGLDPRSSAPWFDGWRRAVPKVDGEPPVVSARTWLARAGWRRWGLIDVAEAPRGSPQG